MFLTDRSQYAQLEIIKHIFLGKGYGSLTPLQLTDMISGEESRLHLIDLSEGNNYQKNHIEHAVLKPIDGFIKEIYARKFPQPQLLQKIILVCDTGQLSRFTLSVFAKKGYARVLQSNRWYAPL